MKNLDQGHPQDLRVPYACFTKSMSMHGPFTWLLSYFQVDELAKQIKLEFDFEREARIMDTIRGHLRKRGGLKNIEIPNSVPGLTTKRLLVMSFIDGVQV